MVINFVLKKILVVAVAHKSQGKYVRACFEKKNCPIYIDTPEYLYHQVLLEVGKRQHRLRLLPRTPDQQYLLPSHFSFSVQRYSDTPSHVSLEDPTAGNERKFKILIDFKWMSDDRGIGIMLGRF